MIAQRHNMIPTVEQCFAFMKQYQMLDNIKAHSLMVEKIASVIGRALKEVGVELSMEKITAGALMHDIGKTPCLNTGQDHGAQGREICLQNEMGEIADIVGEHIRLQNFNPTDAILEKEIVYYADKRVNHDVIVSLQERLAYLLRRYARNEEHLSLRIRKNFNLCKRVERKLFAQLNFRPEDLPTLVK